MASEATGHQENEDRDGGRLEMSREQFPLENFRDPVTSLGLREYTTKLKDCC